MLAAFPALPLADYLALVRDVEARGYHTAWLGETAGGDAITLMTLIASHTERLGVASGVIPIQTRSPIVLGMSAATLAHVAAGRVALGIGVSSRIIVEQGDEGFCRARIAEFARAGLTMPVIFPYVPEGADRRATIVRTLAAFP